MNRKTIVASAAATATLGAVLASTLLAGGAQAVSSGAAPAASQFSRTLGPYGTVYGLERDKYGQVVGTIYKAYCATKNDLAIGLQYGAGSASSSVVTNLPITAADGRQGWSVTVARSAAQSAPRAVCLVAN